MVLAESLDLVTKALKTLVGTMGVGVRTGNNVDEALRALGTTFEQQALPLTESMLNMRGSLTERTVPALLAMQAGLQGQSDGVRTLINQQRLTGTAYVGTAKAFAKLEAMAGLQRSSTNDLGENIIQLGGQFQVTTDVLVGAIEGLSDNMIDIDLMGLPDHIVAAITQVQSEVGPALAKPFNQAVDILLGTSMKSLQQRTSLGLEDVQTRLHASMTQDAAAQIFKEALIEGGQTYESVGKGLNVTVAAANAAFGQNAKNFVPLLHALTDARREEQDTVADFGNSLRVIMSEVLVPFQLVFMNHITPILLRFAEKFKDLSDDLMPKFAAWLETATTWLIELATKIPEVLVTLGNVIHGIWIALSNLFKSVDWAGIGDFINEAWESMSDMFTRISNIDWGNIGNTMKEKASSMWDTAMEAFTFGVDTVQAILVGVGEKFDAVFKQISAGIAQFLSELSLEFLKLKLFVHNFTSLTEDFGMLTEAGRKQISIEGEIIVAKREVEASKALSDAARETLKASTFDLPPSPFGAPEPPEVVVEPEITIAPPPVTEAPPALQPLNRASLIVNDLQRLQDAAKEREMVPFPESLKGNEFFEAANRALNMDAAQKREIVPFPESLEGNEFFEAANRALNMAEPESAMEIVPANAWGAFLSDMQSGTWGTKAFGGLIDPVHEVLLGIKDNTAETAKKLPEPDAERTRPEMLKFTESELERDVRSIAGFPPRGAVEEALNSLVEISLQIEAHAAEPREVELNTSPVVVPDMMRN